MASCSGSAAAPDGDPPLELLDRDTLTCSLDSRTRSALNLFEIFAELDSTNAFLLRAPHPPIGCLNLALAESQTAGRGRRGRRWAVPFGCGIMLSAGWRFARQPAALSALSLAVGVVVRDALAAAGVADVALKWPNDLVWQEGKLGGILVEAAGDGAGPALVVVGIGINVSLDAAARGAIASNWGRGPVDVQEACSNAPPSRNRLAAAVINALHDLLDRYDGEGFAPYRPRFAEADFLAGRSVRVSAPEGELVGRAAGVDSDGALLVRTSAGTRRVLTGEVRLRGDA